MNAAGMLRLLLRATLEEKKKSWIQGKD